MRSAKTGYAGKNASHSPEGAVDGVAATPATMAALAAWAGVGCGEGCVVVDGSGHGYQQHRLSAGVWRIGAFRITDK